MEDNQRRDAKRYRMLRDYLLLNGIVRHIALFADDSEPYVMGTNFYVKTFGDAVDTLDTSCGG